MPTDLVALIVDVTIPVTTWDKTVDPTDQTLNPAEDMQQQTEPMGCTKI